jgi:translation initiation factor 5A
MAAIDDYSFEQADAGSALTTPSEAGLIRSGGLLMIKNHPCKVSDISTSKTGKHGSAKCNISAYHIFNGRKLEDMLPSSTTVQVPIIKRTEYTLMDINDEDYMTLLDEEGATREDLKLPEYPEGYGHELRKLCKEEEKELIVTVLKSCGHEQVMSHKIAGEEGGK